MDLILFLSTGFTLKLLKHSNTLTNGVVDNNLIMNGHHNNHQHNNHTNGHTDSEIFIEYDDGLNQESGFLEQIDSGQTPPILIDLLQLRLQSPDDHNELSSSNLCQEIDLILTDHRRKPRSYSRSSYNHSSNYYMDLNHLHTNHDRMEAIVANDPFSQKIRLKSSNQSIMRTVRSKLISLNHHHRRIRSNFNNNSLNSVAFSHNNNNSTPQLMNGSVNHNHLNLNLFNHSPNHAASNTPSSSSVVNNSSSNNSNTSILMTNGLKNLHENGLPNVPNGNLPQATCPSPAKKKKRKHTNASLDSSLNVDGHQPTPISEELEADHIECQVIFNSSGGPLNLDPSPVGFIVQQKLLEKEGTNFIISNTRNRRQQRKALIELKKKYNKKRIPLMQVKAKSVSKSKGKSGADVLTNGLPNETASVSRIEDINDPETDSFIPLHEFLLKRNKFHSLLNQNSVNSAKSSSNSSNPNTTNIKPLESPTIRAYKKLPLSSGLSHLINCYPFNPETAAVDMVKISDEIQRSAQRKAVVQNTIMNNRNQHYDNSLVKVEEYLMEFDTSSGNQSPIKANVNVSPGITSVSIFHRAIDDLFFGQLFVDRSPSANSLTTGDTTTRQLSSSAARSCLFRLGSREAAKAYLEQFTEILTENGRKTVKITRSGVGAGIPQTQTVVTQQPTVMQPNQQQLHTAVQNPNHQQAIQQIHVQQVPQSVTTATAIQIQQQATTRVAQHPILQHQLQQITVPHVSPAATPLRSLETTHSAHLQMVQNPGQNVTHHPAITIQHPALQTASGQQQVQQPATIQAPHTATHATGQQTIQIQPQTIQIPQQMLQHHIQQIQVQHPQPNQGQQQSVGTTGTTTTLQPHNIQIIRSANKVVQFQPPGGSVRVQVKAGQLVQTSNASQHHTVHHVSNQPTPIAPAPAPVKNPAEMVQPVTGVLLQGNSGTTFQVIHPASAPGTGSSGTVQLPIIGMTPQQQQQIFQLRFILPNQ